MLLVISRSETLRTAATDAAVETHWVSDPAQLEAALNLEPRRVLVDLNLEPHDWSLEAIQKSKASQLPVVAFMGHFAGRTAILASLAGADRVISEEQLIDELGQL